MSTEHTPGPWHVAVGEQYTFHDTTRVAIVCRGEDGGEATESTIAEVWPAQGDADIADGYLIAAAPALLAAAERLLLATLDSRGCAECGALGEGHLGWFVTGDGFAEADNFDGEPCTAIAPIVAAIAQARNKGVTA